MYFVETLLMLYYYFKRLSYIEAFVCVCPLIHFTPYTINRSITISKVLHMHVVL